MHQVAYDGAVSPTPDCVFCEIVAGRAPASVAFADDVALCFMDIAPVNPGHLLVVPRRHASGLAELDEETGAHLFTLGMRMADALRASGLRCEGVNLFLADGRVAGQDVFHVHLHVLPRFAGDPFRVELGRTVPPSREALDDAAAAIGTAHARLPQG